MKQVLAKNERGASLLIILIIVAGLALVATKIYFLTQPKTNSLVNPNVITQSQVNSSTDLKTQTENLNKYLIAEAALLGVTDNISLYFKDIQKNLEVGVDPTKAWIPASTIKTYVLLEAYRQRRLGLIDFNQEVTITADNVVSTELETDEFPRLREGTKVQIGQLVQAMIIQSDNTAYNTLLDILDRRNINKNLRNIGITETVVGEKLNLDADQFQQDLTVPGRQPNTTTVKDMAALFSILYSHQVPDSEEMLGILKKQKINNMIPARLPDNIAVAHKTGDWAPIYHDGGIVYKPSDPFVFVAFTNSGDPAIVAKLAQVAYFQDAQHVGKSLTFTPTLQPNLALKPSYYTDSSEQVLAATSDGKFPSITAEDLGITSKDLVPDTHQVSNVHSALILPGSLLYNVKKTIENISLNLSFSNNQKSQDYLSQANNRLSEIKSLLSKSDVSQTDQLLSDAVSDIKNAINLTKNDPQKEQLLVKIKKTYDLYYAVMADRAAQLPDNKKEEFVNSVYDFYQKSKANISPVLSTSVIVNPTQQKPTIGIVTKVSQNQLTLKFDDGSTKNINLSSGTNVRSVDQETSEDLNTVQVGNKVAILGPSGANNIINAQFILNNIPKGLTDQHTGTVTEVDPNHSTLKVIDPKGQVNLVKISGNTTLKSTDTDISLEGIKAGSQVVVFGVPGQSESSSSASSKPSTNPSNNPSSAPTSSPKTSAKPGTSIPNSSIQPSSSPASAKTMEIKATSITIVGNSSGKNEKRTTPAQSKSSTNNTPAKPSNSNLPPAAPSSNSGGGSSGGGSSSGGNKKDSKK